MEEKEKSSWCRPYDRRVRRIPDERMCPVQTSAVFVENVCIEMSVQTNAVGVFLFVVYDSYKSGSIPGSIPGLGSVFILSLSLFGFSPGTPFLLQQQWMNEWTNEDVTM